MNEKRTNNDEEIIGSGPTSQEKKGNKTLK